MDNPAVSISETPAKSFPSSSGEMFDQYFTQGSKCSYKKNDLLDPRARRLFESTALACSVDAYPFQIPLEGRPGPIVTADGHQMLMHWTSTARGRAACAC
jgi:glycine C-acetyltransferase